MALTLKMLSQRRGLTSSSGVDQTILYPPPSTTSGSPNWYQPESSSKSALIKNIIITNTGSGGATVKILFKPFNDTANTPTANEVYISPGLLQIPAGQQIVLDQEITLYLFNGTTINTTGWGPEQIRCSAITGTIDVLINGLERDL